MTKKKYYIHTLGCKVNQYESQLISDKFKNDNFERTQKPEEANIIILNSCTVTAKTDRKCKRFLRKTAELSNKPKIILTGCIARNKNICIKNLFPNVEVITDKTKLFTEPQKQRISWFDKHSRAFLKIQDGCNSFCTYCIIPYVRNILWSKPEKEILSEIENLVKSNYSEIVITGIHIGKYNDSASNAGLSELTEKIIKIPLDFRIRISSIELNEIDDKMINLMKENPDKICRHLHVPLQSGSNEILKRMNRKYSITEFERKINKIVQTLPDLALTTDIIAGFPTETKKNHKETCDFIKRTPFARLHIFGYSDRQGTKALSFKNKVGTDEIKNRTKELLEINCEKRKNFLKKYIGTKRKAVKIGKDKALTDNYITVKIQQFKNNIPEKHKFNFSASHSNLLLDRGIFEVEVTETSQF